jgi:hypothetical protein
MFKKISHNRLKIAKMLLKCCAKHQKPDAFQSFCPTFQKQFLKRDFFDSFNGLRYLRVAGVNNVWGQKKHEASISTGSTTKMLDCEAQSPPSNTRLCWAAIRLARYQAGGALELLKATTALLNSKSNAVGAQTARSPALGVIKLRKRLNAANATTNQTSQRDARDHPGKMSPARAHTTKTIPPSNVAWTSAAMRSAGGN